MLSDDAHQVIERQLGGYSWTDLAGLDEEMDGMIILALILCGLHPHHKVDMYAEIGTIKMILIAQYDNMFICTLMRLQARSLQLM